MRLIIAGSRGIDNFERVSFWCNHLFQEQILNSKEIEVVSGMAKGVDRFGERWANSYKFPVVKFSADWDAHGKGAGYVRNQLMAEYATELVAFWDGKSKGTKHMIQCMLDLNKPFQVILLTASPK